MTKEQFAVYCVDQIDRMGVFREYRFLKPPAIAEYTNWLIRVSVGDKTKAQAVIDEAVEQDEFPELKDLRAIHARLYPRPRAREASLDCQYCRGEGYETFEKPNGTSYADRCRCGGYPRSQPLTHEELMAPKDEELAALLAEAVEAKSL